MALLLWSRWAAELALFNNPHPLRPPLAVIFMLTTGLMFVGSWTPFSVLATAGVTGAIYTYGAIFPGRTAWEAHHTYLLVIATLLCALMPSGKSFSVDRWLAVRRASRRGVAAPPERGNLWAQRLLAIQVALIYFWSAVDKTHWGYLTGARLEHIFMSDYFGSQYPDWWPGFHAMCVVLAWSTLLVEYTLAFGLFVRRLQPWLLAVGVLFHVGLYLFLRVQTFSLTMILLYLAFLDPDHVHRWIDEVQTLPK